ncbi:hypothetical protein [Aurantimicrobium sp. MWH-Uga1]
MKTSAVDAAIAMAAMGRPKRVMFT